MRKGHADLPRSGNGAWLTRMRMRAGLRQHDLALVLNDANTAWGNGGRVSEWESGRKEIPVDACRFLTAFFRAKLGERYLPAPWETLGREEAK